MPHQASRVIADGELDFGPGDEITSRGSIEQGAPRTTKRRSLVETFFRFIDAFCGHRLSPSHSHRNEDVI